MASPGVVFSMRFVQSKDAKDNYSRYAVGYMSRPEVFEKNLEHDSDPLYHDTNPIYDQYGYMSDKDKTDGLFDANEDIVSDYHKYLYSKTFDESQKKGCPLYQGVISFDNEFLSKNNINFKTAEGIAKLKEIARPAIAAMIHDSILSDSNVVWTAAIHHNTDNIHIHIAIVEKEKVERRFDRLEETAFEKLKSRVANDVVGNAKTEDLKTISDVLNTDIPKWIGSAVSSSDEQIQKIIETIPHDIPWQYNRNGMEKYHSLIDECVVNTVTNNPELLKQFEKAVDAMNRCELLYREMYGVGKYDRANEWSQSKLKEFYERAGNALLREAKNYLNIEENEAELQNHARPAGEKIELPDLPNEDIPEPPEFKTAKLSSNKVNIDELKKLSAGDNDYAKYRLGIAYLNGKGVPKDEKKAIELLRSSADLGNAYAAYKVAGLFEKDGAYDKNIPLAEYYYYKAFNYYDYLIDTENPQKDAVTYYKLAEMVLHGEGMPYDINKAVSYYELSARSGSPIAMYKLGLIYSSGAADINGGGIKKDEQKALLYFKLSAEKGNANAAYKLGKIYRDGTAKDKDEAVKWFKISADSNNQYAQYTLANIYKKDGNMEEAVKYFKRCADQGNSYAQYALGKSYFYGDGVDKSIARAIELFTEARNGGNEYAAEALKRCYKSKDSSNTNKESNYTNKKEYNPSNKTKQPYKKTSHQRTGRGYSQQKNLCSLRASVNVNRAVKRLARDYECEVNRLERDFDYEQDYQIASERGMNL